MRTTWIKLLIQDTSILAVALLLVNGAKAQEQNFKQYSQSVINAEVRIEMVPIQAGTFEMGTGTGEKVMQPDEAPQHKVSVSAFWMSAHEITWDVYNLFVYRDSTRQSSSAVDAVSGPTKPYIDITFGMGKEGFPAVAMTQYNAIQFCKWLYKQTGVFYRLPTEAEWEYACRAGARTPYTFGDDVAKLENFAWYEKNSKGKTMPVGTKQPNAWGLYDMHGNVAEWTNDQYVDDAYKQRTSGVVKDPIVAADKLYPHTLRGGSFIDVAEDCRCASRKPSDPMWKRLDPQIPKSNWWFPEAPFVGLRIVRPLQSPSPEEIEEYYNRKPIRDF